MKTKVYKSNWWRMKQLILMSAFLLMATAGFAQENLSISMTGPADGVPGEVLTYTITYDNQGTSYADDVVITMTLPGAGKYTLLQTIPQGQYNPGDHTLTWNSSHIPSLGRLGSGPFNILVKLIAGVNYPSNSNYYPTGYYMQQRGANVFDNQVEIVSNATSTPKVASTNTVVNMLTSANINNPYGVVKSATGSLTYHLVRVTNSGNVYDNFRLYPFDFVGYDCDGSGPQLFDELIPKIVNLDGSDVTHSGWLAPGQSKYFYMTVVAPQGTTPNGDSWNCQDFMAESRIAPVQVVGQGQIATEIVGNVSYPLVNISKVATPDPVDKGEIITYSIYVFNSNEKATANNVTVTETFPEGTSLVSVTSNRTPQSSTANSWTYPTLAFGPQNAILLTIELLVLDESVDCTGSLFNSVKVEYDEGGPITSNLTTDIVSHADLVITKTAGLSEAFPGDEITYTLEYSNQGNCVRDNVVIKDIFDLFHTTIVTDGGGTVSNNEITWNLGALNPGDQGTKTFTLKVNVANTFQPGTTVLNNIATIIGDGTTEEIDYDNNTSNWPVSVKILPDLKVTKSLSEALVLGEESTYTITVSNIGDVSALNAVVKDVLPAGLTVNESTISDGGTLTSGTITWPPISTFLVGQMKTYTFNVTPDCSAIASSPITNLAEVWSDTPDKNELNNEFELESTITDDELPVITAASDIEQTADASACGAAITIVDATATDNCGVDGSPVGTRDDGLALTDVYPVGLTTITWTVSDIHGNAAVSAEQTVTVTDDEDPMINCPVTEEQVVEANESCVYAVSGTGWDATATDNCGVTSLTYTLTGATTDSGGTSLDGVEFNLGSTTVTWTAINGTGNEITCSFTVVVNDVSAPTFTCNDFTVTLDENNPYTITPEDLELIATDIQGGCTEEATDITISVNIEEFTCETIGEQTVTVTVTDASGNSSTCETTITVVDPVDPTITCAGDVEASVQSDESCLGFVTVPAPTVADNCGIASVTNDFNNSDDASGDYPVGETVVTWTVTDNDGNTATCEQRVVLISGPLALDDEATLEENEDVQIYVLDNDEDCDENLDNTSLTITSQPAEGTATVNVDGSITYKPNIAYYGSDQLTYQICDEDGQCDEATVSITITPNEDLLIPNGFSPNGDGINDYFRVRGISRYPNAQIEVYNRWGAKVYKRDRYGDIGMYGNPGAWWDGRSNVNGTSNSEILPEGTYFIILILDGSNVHKGTLYINR